MNAVENEEAISKLAEQPFDPAQFPYAFLEAFIGQIETTQNSLRNYSIEIFNCALQTVKDVDLLQALISIKKKSPIITNPLTKSEFR